ncbi:MAG: hypothetical protein J7503_04935 [Cellulomonas iranensis]|uniref:Membrane channel-forming protein YqfA (Hemolysin III family) n=1 Tax=Cellulomonas iranensis TaxID=76862 RepID=A0ABU0GK84_9CELL|nr:MULTISPECIES: hypothetical protein [Cellulomonas]MBO9568152.1 hypothetical protein [Cellulomonas iranensis]MDQ0425779.1 putative membrane channel-forming protein YqfA (hemolysin III family) [Cellulomonas iranensis]TFH71957.1 hypothetical protein E4A51_07445 [Cellulomonas sp. HD19AZ1]UCN15220.1 hypothetical protein LFM56_02510 [Cellulomonas iranensis]
MSVETRSVVTAVLAAVVAVAGYFGMLPLAVVSAVLVVALAVGWPALAGLPFTPGAGAVVGLGGLGAVAAVTITPEDPFLQHMALVLAGAVVLAFVNELLRRDGRVRMVESVSGTVTGTVLAVCVTGWVATARLTGGDELVVAGAIALALGSAAVALRGRPWVVYLVTVAAATAGGTLVGWLLPTVHLTAGVALGVGVGVLVAAMHALFDRLPALVRRVPALAVVVLPVTVTGVLVYVAGRVLAG